MAKPDPATYFGSPLRLRLGVRALGRVLISGCGRPATTSLYGYLPTDLSFGSARPARFDQRPFAGTSSFLLSADRPQPLFYNLAARRGQARDPAPLEVPFRYAQFLEEIFAHIHSSSFY